MAEVRRHAIVRFRQRVAPLPAQEIVAALRAVVMTAPPVTDPHSRQVTAQWGGLEYTVVIAGSTVLTVWR